MRSVNSALNITVDFLSEVFGYSRDKSEKLVRLLIDVYIGQNLVRHVNARGLLVEDEDEIEDLEKLEEVGLVKSSNRNGYDFFRVTELGEKIAKKIVEAKLSDDELIKNLAEDIPDKVFSFLVHEYFPRALEEDDKWPSFSINFSEDLEELDDETLVQIVGSLERYRERFFTNLVEIGLCTIARDYNAKFEPREERYYVTSKAVMETLRTKIPAIEIDYREYANKMEAFINELLGTSSDEEMTDEKMMVELYKEIISFEKKLREFILSNLKKLHGEENWLRGIPNDARKNWEKRRNDDKENGLEVMELIDYADFNDYWKILLKRDNWRNVFSKYFRDKEKVRIYLQDINNYGRKRVMHGREIKRGFYEKVLLEIKWISEKMSS